MYVSLFALVQHVLDSSAPNIEEHRSTVLQVLQQIGVSQDKINSMIEVWNKIDIVDNNDNDVTDDIEDEIFLTEGEEDKEEELFSENDVPAEESSFESLDDGTDSEYLSEENLEGNNGEISSSLEPSEMRAMNSVSSSSKDCFGELCGPETISTDGCSSTQPMSTCHVKTSAVTGTGLQELLELIDKKLTERQTIVERSYGPFDRKWRPSSSVVGEKAAEQ